MNTITRTIVLPLAAGGLLLVGCGGGEEETPAGGNGAADTANGLGEELGDIGEEVKEAGRAAGEAAQTAFEKFQNDMRNALSTFEEDFNALKAEAQEFEDNRLQNMIDNVEAKLAAAKDHLQAMIDGAGDRDEHQSALEQLTDEIRGLMRRANNRIEELAAEDAEGDGGNDGGGGS